VSETNVQGEITLIQIFYKNLLVQVVFLGLRRRPCGLTLCSTHCGMAKANLSLAMVWMTSTILMKKESRLDEIRQIRRVEDDLEHFAARGSWTEATVWTLFVVPVQKPVLLGLNHQELSQRLLE
jgi:hypothetical protein